jgi:hypothetical protein
MRFFEIDDSAQGTAPVPTVVKQQQRVGKVVKQIAASEKQQKPTVMDKVLAMRLRARQQKQADSDYTAQLKKQLRLATAKK